MSNAHVLATPKFTKPFVIECDMLGFGIGAILMQDEHPIAFESRNLSKKECLKYIDNKEILAIMHALAKWGKYMLGSKFLIQTNHNSLQHLFQQKTLSKERHKWIKKNYAFDMDTLHKKGIENMVADAFSRKDE